MTNEPSGSSSSPRLVSAGWVRVLVFCICYLFVFLVSGSLYYSLESSLLLTPETFFFLSFAFSFAISLATVYVFRRAMDGRSFISLGFPFKGYEHDALIGLLLGIVLTGIQTAILYFTGHLRITGMNFDLASFFTSLVLMAFVAVSEETVFRGYILNNLMQSVNKWLALGITSLLFALFHSGNPGSNPLALFNIFLAGFVLGINYIFTKNLWFAIMFHFSWNFFLGPVLGYEVSGLPLQGILEQEVRGEEWITGGSFGLEGSVLDGLFSVLVFPVLYRIFSIRKKKEWKLQNEITTP